MMTVKRVAAAVIPMDLFTGARVRPGTVRVWMEDGEPGIRKEDGSIIFLDSGEPERSLIVESPYYEREQIMLCMNEFQGKRSPVLFLWLKPGPAYPYPSGVRLRTETGKPGSTVCIPMEESEGLVSLVGAYPADRLEPQLIQLKVPEGLELEGRTLQIRRLSDGKKEDFTIWETRNRSLGLYGLICPLEGVYSIFDSSIVLIMQVKADQKGNYRVPEPTLPEPALQG